MQSEPGKLNRVDLKKWMKNLVKFFIPLFSLYVGSVSAKINAGQADVSIFFIDPLVAGGMILYVLNALMDLAQKFVAGPK